MLTFTDVRRDEVLDEIDLNTKGDITLKTGKAEGVVAEVAGLSRTSGADLLKALEGWSNGYLVIAPGKAIAASYYSAHAAFCRNPLHPGPCKGWKNSGPSATPKSAAKPKATPKPKAPAPAPKAPAATPAKAAGQPVAPAGSVPPPRVTPASAIGTPHPNEDSSLIYSAKGVAKAWQAHTDSLNDQQKAAIKTYTGPGYLGINAALRKPPGAKLSSIEKEAVKVAEVVQSSMAPSPASMTVFRGMNTNALGLGSGTPTPEQVKALEGSVMVNDAFTSTTIDPAQSFSGNISMEVEVPRGTPSVWAEPFSEYEEEQELLLAAGAKMKILSVEIIPPAQAGDTVSYKFKVRIVP